MGQDTIAPQIIVVLAELESMNLDDLELIKELNLLKKQLVQQITNVDECIDCCQAIKIAWTHWYGTWSWHLTLTKTN